MSPKSWHVQKMKIDRRVLWLNDVQTMFFVVLDFPGNAFGTSSDMKKEGGQSGILITISKNIYSIFTSIL